MEFLETSSSSAISSDTAAIKLSASSHDVSVDSTTRFVLEDSLTEWGYKVISATDGNEAWETLNKEDPLRLALIDWMMPGIDWVSLCQRFKEDKSRSFTYGHL